MRYTVMTHNALACTAYFTYAERWKASYFHSKVQEELVIFSAEVTGLILILSANAQNLVTLWHMSKMQLVPIPKDSNHKCHGFTFIFVQTHSWHSLFYQNLLNPQSTSQLILSLPFYKGQMIKLEVEWFNSTHVSNMAFWIIHSYICKLRRLTVIF